MTTPAASPADLAVLEQVRDQWIAVGNSTAPADRERAEQGVATAYRAAGLNPPSYVFWVGSPWAAVVAVAALPEVLSCGDASGPVKVSAADHLAHLRSSTAHNPAVDNAAALQVAINTQLDPIENTITAALTSAADRRSPDRPGEHEMSQVLATVRADLTRQLSAYAETGPFNANPRSVADPITTGNITVGEGVVPREIDNIVMERVTNPVVGANREDEHQEIEQTVGRITRHLQRADPNMRNKIENWHRGRIWAQYNSGYYAFVSGLDALGYDISPMQGQLDIAASVGWWWAFQDFTIFTERPTAVRYDPQGRLHCADAPAIEYPDGWGVYVWQGHRVPAWVIKNPTVERITGETNTEVRRCAIESYGWDRFIADAQLHLADACPDPGNPGHQLELYDVPAALWGSRVRVLLCTNGSPRADGVHPRFGLRIPADRNIDTALAAAAWGYDLTPEQYASMQRRA